MVQRVDIGKPKLLKSALLLVVGCLLSVALHAEWVAVPRLPNLGQVYFDPESVQAQGTNKRVRQLTDSETSMVASVEYDCAKPRYQLLRADMFLGRMGNGEKKSLSMGPPSWQSVDPKSTNAIIRDRVCAVSDKQGK